MDRARGANRRGKMRAGSSVRDTGSGGPGVSSGCGGGRPGRVCTMPAAYPQEFRDDVVRVARNREPGQKLSMIAKDFGISESCLTNWMREADVEDGARPGKTREESSELRDLRRRNRLLEQENEVLRRAAAYLSQANLPGKSSTRS